jgi:ubiquinone/menaquinone biosynthesis C-methylase UbiE
MPAGARPFIPAAGHDFVLPLYDPLTSLVGAAARRQLLIERAELAGAERVLDVGCGTGSLAIAIKRAYPHVDMVALDPDPRALARAQRKAARAGVQVQFERGFGDALPYAEASFARVFSSFMLHHLAPAVQQGLLAEALRVLSPGGSLHLIDFARADRERMFGRKLQGAEHVARDMCRVGFADVCAEPQPRWLLQRVMYSFGRRPV